MADTNVPFARVLSEELKLIELRRTAIVEAARAARDERREKLARLDRDGLRKASTHANADQNENQDERLAKARRTALSMSLAGLALSGGGIRSATFAIGVLQGLATLRLLRFFDILSTVSGGGYAGAWLATWICREGDPLNVERQLDISRIGQADAVRRSVGPVALAVAETLNGELEDLLDDLSARFGAASPDRSTTLEKFRERVVNDLRDRVDELKGAPSGEIKRLVRERIDDADGDIRDWIEESEVRKYDSERTAIVRRMVGRLYNQVPRPSDGAGDPGPLNAVVDVQCEPTRGPLVGNTNPDADRTRNTEANGVASNPTSSVLDNIAEETLRNLFDSLESRISDLPDGARPEMRRRIDEIRKEIVDAVHKRVHELESPQPSQVSMFVQYETDRVDDRVRNWIGECAISSYRAKLDGMENRIVERLKQPLGNGDRKSQVADVVDEEPEPIRHLRRYSSYMNPRAGLFSADSWTLAAIYTRNILINLLLLLPLVMTLVLLARGIIHLYDDYATATSWDRLRADKVMWYDVRWYGVHAFLTGFGLVILAFLLNAVALWRIRSPERKSHRTSQTAARVLLYSMFAGAILIMMAYPPFLRWMREKLFPRLDESSPALEYLGWNNITYHIYATAGLMLVLALPTLCSLSLECWKDKAADRRRLAPIVLWLVAAVGGGAVMGVLITVVEKLLWPTIENEKPWLRAMCGPPMFALAVVIGIVAQVALLGSAGLESEREWWGRLAARLLRMGLGWFVVLGVIVYGPAVLLGSHQLIAALLTSGWVATTVAGVLAGKSGGTGCVGGDRRLEWVALVAPSVFLIGLLAMVSTLATNMLNFENIDVIGVQETFHRAVAVYLLIVRGTSGWRILACLGVSFIIMVAGFWLVRVNLFSLNAMYANRLTRAFLGASRRTDESRKRWAPSCRDQRVLAGAPTGVIGLTRDPNPVTGFDPDDDLELAELRIGAGDNSARYWGPHIVLNTTLNLVGGDELAWRNRKAESFMLTPLYCGARSTGYVATPPKTGSNLSVGRAISISGAAVDPNMNFHQSASVTMLLTVFNARLGAWIQNPNRGNGVNGTSKTKEPAEWAASGPNYGFLLLKEFLGWTDEKGNYVHISDGGHFDNLGVYELVKRRCRYIVAVDASESPLATSDNLGILVRLCRVDLGVRVEVSTAPLRVDGPDRTSHAHVAIGRIRYDDVDHGQTPGMLVYIKTTMTGDEPPDVQHYANFHPEFPRQSTVDQSFDEDQFESYRALGAHIARVVFQEAAQAASGELKSDKGAVGKCENLSQEEFAEARFRQAHRKMFSALRNRWTEAPVRVDDRYAESTRSWRNLQRDLRREEALADLARDLYPELAIRANAMEGPKRRAELHKMEEILQFMEDAWTGLGMKDNEESTIGRGWFNVFRRIAGSATFRLFWPLLRAECNPEFARFCERQLRASRMKPTLLAIGPEAPELAIIGAELAREWPRAVSRRHCASPAEAETLAEAGRRFLRERVENATLPAKPGTPEMKSAWLIFDGPVEYEPAKETGFEFPLGIFVVFSDQSSPAVSASRPSAATAEREHYEVLLWIRRPHRSAGVGEMVLRGDTAAEVIIRLGLGPSTVRARYPAAEETGAEDPDRVRWLAFFSLFGYRPESKDPSPPDPEKDPSPPDPDTVIFKCYPEDDSGPNGSASKDEENRQ